MSLEAYTGKISDLVDSNPTPTDPKSQGDDHLRGIKYTLKQTFPNFDGPLSATRTPFTPAGNVAANNVQAAIQELDTEKIAKSGDGIALDPTGKTVSAAADYNIDPVGTGRQFLVRGAFGLGAQNVPALTGDLSNPVGSGFYSFSPANASRPPGVDYGVLLHLGYNNQSGGNWAQIVIPTSPSGDLYYRTLTNGAFSNWKRLTGVAV